MVSDGKRVHQDGVAYRVYNKENDTKAENDNKNCWTMTTGKSIRPQCGKNLK